MLGGNCHCTLTFFINIAPPDCSISSYKSRVATSFTSLPNIQYLFQIWTWSHLNWCRNKRNAIYNMTSWIYKINTCLRILFTYNEWVVEWLKSTHILEPNGTFCWGSIPYVVLHTLSIISLTCGACLETMFEFEWRATYFGSSWRATPILTSLGIPKRVWP